ncbi:MAG: hypothetical protein U0Y10_08215 [Spirosomataceae bacterium]
MKLTLLSRTIALLMGCALWACQPQASLTDEPTPQATDVASNAVTSPLLSGKQPLYVHGTMHIESDPRRWPDVDKLLNFFKQATALGVKIERRDTTYMKWSVGPDIGWLEGESRASYFITEAEKLGVEFDIHAHNLLDRPRCYQKIIELGGHPNHVCNGVLVSDIDKMRKPLTYDTTSWQAEVLLGFNADGSHGASDLRSIGIWRPKSSAEYKVHDATANMISVGGGTKQLDYAEGLAASIQSTGGGLGIMSVAIMVHPDSLTVPNSGGKNLFDIRAWANRMAAYDFVHWATANQTAEAWRTKGAGIPTRRDTY